MKEFLNKLKTPTKILSIVCIILVLMLFSKCNSANRLRGENHKNVEQIDSLINLNVRKGDSILHLKDAFKDLKIENAINNENKLESRHEAEIKLIKCEAKLKDYENKFSYLQRVINNLKKELEDCKKSK